MDRGVVGGGGALSGAPEISSLLKSRSNKHYHRHSIATFVRCSTVTTTESLNDPVSERARRYGSAPIPARNLPWPRGPVRHGRLAFKIEDVIG
jgi:hypothetical protein